SSAPADAPQDDPNANGSPDQSTASSTELTGPATVSGVVHLPNGQPAPGFSVAVFPQEDPGAPVLSNGESEYPELGTTITDSTGAWSLTLPDQLPGDLQSVVDGNGGVLNVEATAVGTVSGTTITVGAVAAMPAGI